MSTYLDGLPDAGHRLEPGSAGPRGLGERLTPLRETCAARWRATPTELPRLGPHVTWRTQWANARATTRLIDDMAERIESYPAGAAARASWRDDMRAQLQDFGEAHFGWPAGYRRLLFADAFYETSVAFARQARALDSALPIDDLLQALRNVWIGNSLQMLLTHRICLSPGLFAYSMLYPATDNLLDAGNMTIDAKHTFNARLGRRLLGEPLPPCTDAEATVFTLVGLIDSEFPRCDHPDVWESVLAIHRAQIDSLRQQQGPPLSDDELLDLSFAKGGASVLADLYLVAGDVTDDDQRFAFGYGVFLQLLDDLQDVNADSAAGHETLFTRAARRGSLDLVTAQLARFIDIVLDDASSLAGEKSSDCKDLIRRNCRALLVGVIADRPQGFSAAFRRSVERQWPLSFRAMRRLRARAHRRFMTTRERIQRRHGVGSPLELLLESA